ncbi:hypothetical protein HBH51_173630 [Parastagonospora nodorum]|nr:hypothetical protein HBH51_173630 [Parastagonospora nodorum]
MMPRLLTSAVSRTSQGGVPLVPDADFENHCSPLRMMSIIRWQKNVPPPDELMDAFVAPTMDTKLYKDWLHWAEHTAMNWLHRLDKLERLFRQAALIYHKIPYDLRHSSIIQNGHKISSALLKRLSEIFETDRLRSKQTYFTPWIAIFDTATEVLDDLNNHQPLPDEIDSLRTLHHKFELAFDNLNKPCQVAWVALRWLQGTVADVNKRAELDGTETLAASFSREGGLFRRWISTLPEADGKHVQSRLTYIEWYAQTLLKEGVVKDDYWSMLLEDVGL